MPELTPLRLLHKVYIQTSALTHGFRGCRGREEQGSGRYQPQQLPSHCEGRNNLRGPSQEELHALPAGCGHAGSLLHPRQRCSHASRKSSLGVKAGEGFASLEAMKSRPPAATFRSLAQGISSRRLHRSHPSGPVRSSCAAPPGGGFTPLQTHSLFLTCPSVARPQAPLQRRGCGYSPAPPRSFACKGRAMQGSSARVLAPAHPLTALPLLGAGACTPRATATPPLQQGSHKLRQGSSSRRCYFQKATTAKHLLETELRCQAQSSCWCSRPCC